MSGNCFASCDDRISITDLVESSVVDKTKKLCKAIEDQDEYAVSRLLSSNKDINPNAVISDISMSLLHYAVGQSDNEPDIVENILQMGGSPNNTLIEEKLSPMHLAVIFDFDRVLQALMRYGGDPKVTTGEGKSCFDISKDNVESELQEKCFLVFYRRCLDFRKTIKPTDSLLKVWRDNHSESLSDGFYSCQSELESIEEAKKEYRHVCETRKETVSCQLNYQYSFLMTEDESDIDGGRLSTIREESSAAISNVNLNKEKKSVDSSYVSEESNIASPEDELSNESLSISHIENLPQQSPVPPPTKSDLNRLQTAMGHLNIPVTPSTYRVLTKYAHQESRLAEVLSPKPGNFSSELKLCLQNIELIHDWGNLKIELVQKFTPTNKTSKSFYNYLLLDPKILKKANFSGNHLKSSVIRNVAKFETFLRAIFYIGKGCGRRPIQHLVDAKNKLTANRNIDCGEKLDKILEIWKSGLGVVVVSVFHHSSEREANVNEAAMIDAVGLVELSNIKKGSYTGTVATNWSQKTKNQFGSFLLHKCFLSFAVGGHKAFLAQDV